MSDNYLYYDYAKSAICHITEEGTHYTPARSIERYLDDECLQHGSTLKGRQKSFGLIMHQKRFLPAIIQLNPNKVYFPIRSRSDPRNIWICLGNIDHVEYKEKTCTIYFKDHTCLTCEHPKRIYRSIRQIYRYLKIQMMSL